MTHRRATLRDVAQLAILNHQLICDEGHRNRMSAAELEVRMHGWLQSGEYVAVMFETSGAVWAYALFREQPFEIYLRQLFVVRERRRQGCGREAMELLRRDYWVPSKRLTLEVLVSNVSAIAFYHSLGYVNYSLGMEMMPATPAHV